MPTIKASTQKWKDSNSNYGVKVSAATVAKLKKGTKASNIAAANKPGASAEYKEAVRRFYGKGAISSMKTPPTIKQTGPVSQPSKKPTIERGNPKPTQAQINAAKKKNATMKASSLTATRSEQKKPTAGQLSAAKLANKGKQVSALNATRKEQMPKPTDRSKLKPKAKPMGSKIKTLQRKGM